MGGGVGGRADGSDSLLEDHRPVLRGNARRPPGQDEWQEVDAAFPTSWDTVYRAVRMAVDWGLAHRDLTNIEAIGVDELSRRRGQRYLTLVYQIMEASPLPPLGSAAWSGQRPRSPRPARCTRSRY